MCKDTLAHSNNHCCHANATAPSLLIFDGKVVPITNTHTHTNIYVCACVVGWHVNATIGFLALLPSYKIFRTVVNNNKFKYYECTCIPTLSLRHIILPYIRMACLALRYFSTLSHTWHHFQKKKILNVNCVFWFSLHVLFETFLSLIRVQRHTNLNLHGYSSKVPVILVRF